MLLYDNLAAYIEGEKVKLEKLATANLPEKGVIIQVLGPAENQDKATNLDGYSVTRPVEELVIDYEGIHGDRHRRTFHPSTGREKTLYPKGTIIREHRHIFAVSLRDCDELSNRLGVEVTPELLGANLVIAREDAAPYSLSALPIGTHLVIVEPATTEMPRPGIATLVRYAQQQGCGITGNAISKTYGADLTKRFGDESKTNRGIVCSVEYPVHPPAALKVGQTVFFRYSMGVTP
jgi:hypothetical protein